VQRQQDTGSGLDAGLIPITVTELLRLLRDTVIHQLRRDRPTGCTSPPGGAATRTVPAEPTDAGHLCRDNTMVTTTYSRHISAEGDFPPSLVRRMVSVL
jgi:hypothetical protein